MTVEFGNIFNRSNTTKKHIPNNICTAIEKAIVSIMGTNSKSELDVRSWIAFLTGVRNECKYDGCFHESSSW